MLGKSVLSLLLLALPVSAQTITDGDTIKLSGTIYRLWGIDAAESKQLCADGWAAGRAATTFMRELVQGHTVTCEARGTDRYQRTIGLCRADGVDLSAAMVSAGMAWAFVRYSRDYVPQEEAAKAAALGVHAHACQVPWEWRAEHKR